MALPLILIGSWPIFAGPFKIPTTPTAATAFLFPESKDGGPRGLPLADGGQLGRHP